jgi:hypothetical protein
MNVVANFEALQQKYTITLSAQPANGGTVNKSQQKNNITAALM